MTREEATGALAGCRDRIDELDRQILLLLNQRTKIVQEIGRIKQQARMPIYEPRREDEVYANITRHNGGPLGSAAARRVFERIVDEMRKVQKDRMEENQDV